MSSFTPCSQELFFKSSKSLDPRLGEFVNSSGAKAKTCYSIAGYPDDEGIKINGGRTGAALAPDVIRKFFYKMTPEELPPLPFQLEDIGNLKISRNLASRHEFLKEQVSVAITQGKTWIGLGGGHDYGYPDGAGFLSSKNETKYKPLVINFDAHLDVRPDDQGLSSGTPFYRLLMDKSLPAFDFVEVGIQAQCNSPHHAKWLKEKNATVLTFEELNTNNFVNSTFEKLAPFMIQPRPTFLSIDIDAFSSAYAPGCSQSWSTGMIPNDFMPLLKILKSRLDVRCLGIYEVSPPLDVDDRTSKLAAQIMHQFIYA